MLARLPRGNYLFMLTTTKCIAPHCKRVNVRKPLVASINFASPVRASDMKPGTYQLLKVPLCRPAPPRTSDDMHV